MFKKKIVAAILVAAFAVAPVLAVSTSADAATMHHKKHHMRMMHHKHHMKMMHHRHHMKMMHHKKMMHKM